uniref:NUMOD4 domain-containing protein n=1 Tax=Lentilactobacillus hilgardii TaxID=1588 RepID=UPI00403FA429
MIEKWRKIKGFKGYEISSLGRLRSHRIGHKYTNTVPTRMLHPSINGNGYYVLSFWRRKNKKAPVSGS